MSAILSRKFLEQLTVEEVEKETSQQGSYMEIHSAGNQLIGVLTRAGECK